MTGFNGICAFARSFAATVGKFLRSRQGVAAVEFAFVVPVLLILYFVTIEFSHAIETNKKVGRAASMIADLITQQPTMTAGNLDAIMQIGESTLQPYNRSTLSIHAVGINISGDSPPLVTVAWSRQMVNGTNGTDPNEKAGDETTVPDSLKMPGTFLVRVEATLDYRPIIAWTADQRQTLGLLAAFDNIDMSEHYYLRPRMSNSIPCNDC